MTGFTTAAGLAVGLAVDPTLRITRGPWAYDPSRHQVQLDVEAKHMLTPYQCGLIGHEIAHAAISVYGRFRELRGLGVAQSSRVMNALEDPRVQSWFDRASPGGRTWMDAVRGVDRLGGTALPPSALLQFAMAASIADAWTWRTPDGWVLDPLVIGALAETRDARRRYAEATLPLHDYDVRMAHADLLACLDREVAPLLRAEDQRPPERRSDAIVLIAGARGFRMVEADILPWIHRLRDADLARLRHRADSDQAFQRQLAAPETSPAQRARLVDAALRAVMAGPPGKPNAVEQAAYEDYVAGHQADFQIGVGVTADGGMSHTAETRMQARSSGRSRQFASTLATMLREQVGPLAVALEAAFRTPTQRTSTGRYPSGATPDLRAVMHFEADRREYRRLWTRLPPHRPKPQAAVSLLVDLSGSMAGAEIEAAMLGTALLTATFTRLGGAVAFALHGFQDDLVPPFKTFDSPQRQPSIERLEEMRAEVLGCRRGGRNNPQWNDDFVALRAAHRELLTRPEQHRLLIVVSDGRPAGKHADGERKLHEAVSAIGSSVHLVGLGLGAGTGHVSEFYPHAVADIPPEKFASEIARVVRGALAARRP